jgi:hypothetical protein
MRFRWLLAWPLCRAQFVFFLLASLLGVAAHSVQGRPHIPPTALDDLRGIWGLCQLELRRALRRR